MYRSVYLIIDFYVLINHNYDSTASVNDIVNKKRFSLNLVRFFSKTVAYTVKMLTKGR